MKLKIGEWAGLLFAVTIIYVLVRPNSNASQFVSAVGGFLKALVTSATDTAK